MPLLCFLLFPSLLLSRSLHFACSQNSIFVSFVDSWIMLTKRNRSKRRIAHANYKRAVALCVCWWPVDNGFEFDVRVHSEAGFNLIFFYIFLYIFFYFNIFLAVLFWQFFFLIFLIVFLVFLNSFLFFYCF